MGLLGSGTLKNGGTLWSFDDIDRIDGSSTTSKNPSLAARLGNKSVLLQGPLRSKRAAASTLDFESTKKKIKTEDDLEIPWSFKSFSFDRPLRTVGEADCPDRTMRAGIPKVTPEVVDLVSSDDDEPTKPAPLLRPKAQHPPDDVSRPVKRVGQYRLPAQGDVKPIIRHPQIAQVPFLIDESSDDEITPAKHFPPPSVAHKSLATKPTASKPMVSEETKIAQREQSRRLREEALERQQTATGAGTCGASLAINGTGDVPSRDAPEISPRPNGVVSTRHPLSKAVPMLSSSRSSQHNMAKALSHSDSGLPMPLDMSPKEIGGGVGITTKDSAAPISETVSPPAAHRGIPCAVDHMTSATTMTSNGMQVATSSFAKEQALEAQLDEPTSKPIDQARRFEDGEAWRKLDAMKSQASLDAARSAELERLQADRALEKKKAAEKAALESRRRLEEESRRLVQSRLEREDREQRELRDRQATRHKLEQSNKASLGVLNKEREEQLKQRKAKDAAQKQVRLEQKRLQEGRAQALKDRNARNAQANREAEEQARNAQPEQETDELILENSLGNPSTTLRHEHPKSLNAGPFSLNSAAGRNAMDRRPAHMKPTSITRAPPSFDSNSRLLSTGTFAAIDGILGSKQQQTSIVEISPSVAANIRALGLITAHDAQLYLWKELENFIWSDIIESWSTLTGVVRGEDYLRRRWRQLKELVQHTQVDVGLMRRLVTGERVAVEQVNRLAREAIGAQAVQRDRPTIQLSVRRDSFTVPQPPPPTTATTTSSNAPRVDSTRVVNNHVTVATAPRPTTGGKHIDATLLATMAENVTEACQEVATTAAESESESEMALEDFCYKVYRILYREFILDDAIAGREPDDMRWVECCEAYDNVDDANSAARKFLCFTRTPKYKHPDEEHEESRSVGLARSLRDGFPPDGQDDDEQHYDDSDEGDEEGFGPPQARHSLSSSMYAPVVGEEKYFSLQRGSNIVHVRVVAELRKAMPPIPPRSKKGWLSRTCFRVKQRTCSDALFGEDVVEEEVDNATYTDLTMANSVAVQHFVEKTAKPSSPNLELFCAEKSKMLGELMMRLDAGDVFQERADLKEGWIEVFVEESKLKGPRN
jgi:hypothetical protein